MAFWEGPILTEIRTNKRKSCEYVFLGASMVPGTAWEHCQFGISMGEEQARVEEVNQFPTVERRRNPGLPSGQREKGEVAVFQELGKALTSSLQLDQVLRTIMEKIDEFLRPDNWSLLLLDEAKQELYFELAVGKASQALKDVRIKIGQGIAGWVAQHGETVVVPDTSKDRRFFSKGDEKTQTETQAIVAEPRRFRDTCLRAIEPINCLGT